MKLTTLYGWIVGKMSYFINSFPQDNAALRQQAQSFWKHLDGGTWYFVIAFVAVAILCAWSYYGPFNERPGRHYRPCWWWMFGLATIILSFIVTIAIAYMVAAPKLNGAWSIEIRIALANMIYSAMLYVLMSFGFCNGWFGKTNAYKLLKL